MKINELEYIEEVSKEYHSNLNYLIEAKMDLVNEWVDVTEMFYTPSLLRSMKISKNDRRVIAKNQLGFNQLVDLGFKEIEIIKNFK
jgi:hypothetical protein